MSAVYVTNVIVGRNPTHLLDQFELDVSFECLEPLEEDLEWKLTYVGSPEDKSKDQVLDNIALGPIQRGALRFVFVADAPDFTKIDKSDIDGITIMLLSGLYRNQEFVRIGWYVHNYFAGWPEDRPPPDVDEMTLEQMIPLMKRIILAENPRVTRFNICWDRPDIGLGFPMVPNNVFDPVHQPSERAEDLKHTSASNDPLPDGTSLGPCALDLPPTSLEGQNHNGLACNAGKETEWPRASLPQRNEVTYSHEYYQDTEMGGG